MSRRLSSSSRPATLVGLGGPCLTARPIRTTFIVCRRHPLSFRGTNNDVRVRRSNDVRIHDERCMPRLDIAGTCARYPAGADGGSGTDRMRASVVTVKRPTSVGPAANSRARWLWMYSGDLAWILRNTIPGGVGSRRRNTSSPKSRSKVMTTRCWAAPNASTSSSGAPGPTDRTGTTSCPSACRPRTASRGTFSSARKRG